MHCQIMMLGKVVWHIPQPYAPDQSYESGAIFNKGSQLEYK